jgi:hypothetical protein
MRVTHSRSCMHHGGVYPKSLGVSVFLAGQCGSGGKGEKPAPWQEDGVQQRLVGSTWLPRATASCGTFRRRSLLPWALETVSRNVLGCVTLSTLPASPPRRPPLPPLTVAIPLAFSTCSGGNPRRQPSRPGFSDLLHNHFCAMTILWQRNTGHRGALQTPRPSRPRQAAVSRSKGGRGC